ncbi:MAG TPA: hypothetical protein VEU96_29725 [Bryobacteraceae bacterium]|nr:hypothetical protein [Bryobacteraceae bacterium]
MSALVELQDRIQSTNALIAEHERTVAEIGVAPPRSLLANIRALEKLKRRLEEDYLDVAAQLELEVYRYRLLNESDRVTLTGVAEAWAKFQEFFGSVYSALTKSNLPKKKPAEPQRLELGYGYSFASSVGVVVTVPRDVGFYATSPIEEASDTVFDLIEAKNVSRIADTLGPGPIQVLHQWVSIHVNNQYGIGLEWRSQRTVKRTVEVQYQSLAKLQGTIAETTAAVGLDVVGELFLVNSDTKQFGLKGDNGHEYYGTFGAAITPEHAASVPARYSARIIETTKIIILGDEPKTTLFLERLGPLPT